MVYIPELDRQGFADRQSKQQRRNRPAVNFTRRDDVRDLMKSPAGQNYANMLDLSNQAVRHGGFDKGDPRVAELKKARRQYNRKDKYNIANQMGYSPQDANEIYRQNSGVLREHARPTYKEMYPIGDALHNVGGGLTGMLLKGAFGKGKKAGKNFLDDLRGMGGDIFGGIGIGGAVPRDEATEEILTNYSDKTFGPLNIHDDEPWPYEDEVIEETTQDGNLISDELWDSIRDFDPSTLGKPGNIHAGKDITVAPWLLDPSLPMPEELVEGEYLPGQYHDELIEEEAPPPIASFNDSGREAGIAALYGQGPRWASTNRRYEKEYRDYIMSSGDQIDYDDFERMYEEIYQGKPHALHSSYR